MQERRMSSTVETLSDEEFEKRFEAYKPLTALLAMMVDGDRRHEATGVLLGLFIKHGITRAEILGALYEQMPDEVRNCAMLFNAGVMDKVMKEEGHVVRGH